MPAIAGQFVPTAVCDRRFALVACHDPETGKWQRLGWRFFTEDFTD
jgi:hypothetical protein